MFGFYQSQRGNAKVGGCANNAVSTASGKLAANPASAVVPFGTPRALSCLGRINFIRIKISQREIR
jgi:hypothetical protein